MPIIMSVPMSISASSSSCPGRRCSCPVRRSQGIHRQVSSRFRIDSRASREYCLSSSSSPSSDTSLSISVLERAISTANSSASRPSVPDVAQAMERLRKDNSSSSVPRELVEGQFELVYSTLLRKLPLVDWGYMPTKETIVWDLDNEEMRLTIETLPFLPTIDVVGNSLTYDEATSTLTYQIRDKPPSTWRVFYANDTLFAADSSKTGLCLVRRI
ncbi:hypothetical protein NFJ02_12g09920 [Pycnococcus provasolii]